MQACAPLAITPARLVMDPTPTTVKVASTTARTSITTSVNALVVTT